jgi:hypothetical protein
MQGTVYKLPETIQRTILACTAWPMTNVAMDAATKIRVAHAQWPMPIKKVEMGS